MSRLAIDGRGRSLQGARANRQGLAAESVIAAMMRDRGHRVIRQYPLGTSIYGGDLRADCYVPDLPGFPRGLAIESKWQQVGGTADEKLPYLVANIRHCYPCPAIVVVGGGGIRPGALRWLRAQADGAQLVAIFSLEEFLSWLNRTT